LAGTRYYPERARQQAINGFALIACVMRSNRRVDCAVEAESPEGWEFGESTIRAASELAARRGSGIGPGATFRISSMYAMSDERGRPDRPEIWESQLAIADIVRDNRDTRGMGHRGAIEMLCEIQEDRHLNCYGGEEYPTGRGFLHSIGMRGAHGYELSEDVFGKPGFTPGEHIRLHLVFSG
jgi:hypothetical protein